MLASIGTVSPWIRLASSAENWYVSTARETSPTEYFQAFPASRQMIAAISSWCFASRLLAFSRIRKRRWAGVRDQSGKAAWAAPMARSTVSREAAGTIPIVSPVYLSITGMVSLSPTHFPPTNSRYGLAVTFFAMVSSLAPDCDFPVFGQKFTVARIAPITRRASGR